MSRDPSTSSVQEEIARAIVDYYNALSGEEVDDLSQWSQFAVHEFLKENAYQAWHGSADSRRAGRLGCRTGGPVRARAPAPC